EVGIGVRSPRSGTPRRGSGGWGHGVNVRVPSWSRGEPRGAWMSRTRTTERRRRLWSIVAAAGCVATALVVAAGPASAAGDPYRPTPPDDDVVHAAAANPRPCIDTTPVQLEGYASTSSVNTGGTFQLFVRSLDPAVTTYDATFYRQGPTPTKVGQLN